MKHKEKGQSSRLAFFSFGSRSSSRWFLFHYTLFDNVPHSDFSMFHGFGNHLTRLFGADGSYQVFSRIPFLGEKVLDRAEGLHMKFLVEVFRSPLFDVSFSHNILSVTISGYLSKSLLLCKTWGRCHTSLLYCDIVWRVLLPIEPALGFPSRL